MNPHKLSAFIVISFVLFLSSCKKKEIETLSKNSTSLGTLTASPAFAKPILSANENRIFSILLKDGKQLNFNVTSSAQTMFGVQRVLGGSVTINNKKDKVVMLIGKNGFAINYYYNGHYFILKSNVDLDLGFTQPEVDLNSADFKNQFAAYSKVNGTVKAAAVLANYKKQLITPASPDTDSEYNVVIEQTSLYSLIDRTLTEQKIAAADGLTTVKDDSRQINEKLLLTNSSADNKSALKYYTLEVAYIAPGYNSTIEVATLCFSLIGVDPGMTHVCWSPIFTSITKNKTLMDIVEINSKMIGVHNDDDQIANLITLNNQFPVADGTCRIGLYKAGLWNNKAGGQAIINAYGSQYSNWFSCLIANDHYANHLAHECGHNLGAIHTTNKQDIMFPWGSNGSPFHLDINNIRTILTKF